MALQYRLLPYGWPNSHMKLL